MHRMYASHQRVPCLLDVYAAKAQASQPYLRLSRADVLRMLLDKGLSTTVAEPRKNRLLTEE